MSGLLFCGCGNMGGAVLKAALEKEIFQAQDVVILERYPNDYTKEFAEKGCQVIPELDQLKEKAELVVFAVKPQDAATLFAQLQGKIKDQALLISIMAGVVIETMELFLRLP